MIHPRMLQIEHRGPVTLWTLDRPERRNAVDRALADALVAAVRDFEADDSACVAVLTGRGADFCAGADLQAIHAGAPNRLELEGDAPLGPSRIVPAKPVIAAIEGHAVAGGLELALWCDLRVAGEGATLGVYCRRWGVPLIDGGTVRLPRLIGHARAMDLILTGRGVSAEEALAFGLVNRVVPRGEALVAAVALADSIAAFPQACLRADRRSAIEQWDLPLPEALRNEFMLGMSVVGPEMIAGVGRFTGRARSP